jgi:hypothetical protein
MLIYRRTKEIHSKFSKKLKSCSLLESEKENSKNFIGLKKKVLEFTRKKSKVGLHEKESSEKSKVLKLHKVLTLMDLEDN